ncbi:Superfamily II DNA or RNA helicase [Desulfonatronum zhilinae]|nr:Superfamily II DNA or RNA helicase [Desulfonatronum zhilinae]
MQLILDNQATLAGLSPGPVRREIELALSMKNPAFTEAEKRGRWTGNIDEVLKFYKPVVDGIQFPRGAARMAWNVLHKHGIKPEVVDNRLTLEPVKMAFKGSLRPYQEAAAKAAFRVCDGVLQAATGAGKTVMALKVAAVRKQPCLVVVHSRPLMDQWADRIEAFLECKPGMVGGGKFDARPLTVGMVQTIKNRLPELVKLFGQVIVDECHRTPSTTFAEVVREFPAKFRLGISATPYRRDGLTPLIHHVLGETVHRVDPKCLAETGAVLRPRVRLVKTGFSYDFADDYADMISALVDDQVRNFRILRVIQETAKPALVVSDRVEHLRTLGAMVADKCPDLRPAILHGSTPATKRTKIIEALAEGRVDVLLASASLVGEGFDAPGLSDLILATPCKWSGRLIQICGRVLRPAPGKQPTIHDVADTLQPVLAHQVKERVKVYRQEFDYDPSAEVDDDE